MKNWPNNFKYLRSGNHWWRVGQPKSTLNTNGRFVESITLEQFGDEPYAAVKSYIGPIRYVSLRGASFEI